MLIITALDPHRRKRSGAIVHGFLPRSPIIVNHLNTEIVSEQPGDGPLAVVRTAFNTGFNIGYKYYIYDRDTDTADRCVATTLHLRRCAPVREPPVERPVAVGGGGLVPRGRSHRGSGGNRTHVYRVCGAVCTRIEGAVVRVKVRTLKITSR